MRAWVASLILMFAVLAAGLHTSVMAHDHDGDAVHSHDIAASDHPADDTDDNSDEPAPSGMKGDVVTHYHMSVALTGTGPVVPGVALPDRQARLHAPGKVLVSRSYRPPIQPPSA